MPVSLKTIEEELNSLLQPQQFQDYCPNGLQVQGCQTVRRLVTGVTACQELIDLAVSEKADMLLVHHGYFWKGENPVLTGMKKRRIQTLLQHDINLFGFHLPLDVHPQLGNNAQLGKLLGFKTTGSFAAFQGGHIGLTGTVENPCQARELVELITARLHRKPLLVGDINKQIKTIAWCTGAAQNYIEDAIAAEVDAFITGEVSEPTVHAARESGLCFFAAGHHATERYGAQAVGEYLAEKFQLEHTFIDVDNPV